MKIYAVRDKLLEYYLQPFVAPAEEKAVLAAIARQVNATEDISDIAQAPHQFEVWKLGEIYEDGTIQAEQTLICRCDSLIRAGLRRTPAQPTGDRQAGTPATGSPSPPERTSGHTPTGDSPLPRAPPSAPQQGLPVHTAAGRGPISRDG